MAEGLDLVVVLPLSPSMGPREPDPSGHPAAPVALTDDAVNDLDAHFSPAAAGQANKEEDQDDRDVQNVCKVTNCLNA